MKDKRSRSKKKTVCPAWPAKYVERTSRRHCFGNDQGEKEKKKRNRKKNSRAKRGKKLKETHF
jgi:hypothetical protein